MLVFHCGSEASLEMGVDYALVNETDAQKNSLKRSVQTCQRRRYADCRAYCKVYLGGFNKTVLQYGTEGYSKTMAFYGDGSWYGAEAKDGADGYRLINWGVIPMGNSWEMGHQLVYGVGNQMWDTQG